MAKLQKYELDAVVSTVLDRIQESKKDSPEQIEYDRLCKLEKFLEEQAEKEIGEFKKQLVEKYSKLSNGLEVTVGNNYKGIYISSPSKPYFKVDNRTIERDIIVANISGNVEETIQKIVEKYTK